MSTQAEDAGAHAERLGELQGEPVAEVESTGQGTASPAALDAPEGDTAKWPVGGPGDRTAQEWLGAWLAAMPFQVVSMLATFYALFVPDISAGFLPASSDTAVLGIGLAIVFFFFIIEGILLVYAKPSYVFSLFFMLDLVATFSLIWDIPWIVENLEDDGTDEMTLTRSARLARVGARIGRLGRLFRVLRVFKVLKLMILVRARRWRQEHTMPVADDDLPDVTEVPDYLRHSVQDIVSRRVIILMVATIVGAISLQFYEDDFSAATAFLVLTAAASGGVPPGSAAMERQVEAVRSAVPGIYYLSINASMPPVLDFREHEEFRELRKSEFDTLVLQDNDCCRALYDTSRDKKQKAALNIALIFVIVIILFAGSLQLSTDVVQIVADPTQRLLRTKQTSDALMAVFKAVSTRERDRDAQLDAVISTVLQGARNLLSCRVVNIYFADSVSSVQGESKLILLQSSEFQPSSSRAGGSPYADGLSVMVDESTVVGAIAAEAGSNHYEAGDSFTVANLCWSSTSKEGVPGAVNLLAVAKKRSMAKGAMHSAKHLAHSMSSKVLHRAENKLPHVDPVWTQRWCADPSLHPQSVQVGNQLCMAIVAEVRGVRRVVGMVQALNKIVQVPVNRRRKMSVEDMAFNDYDVDCLSVFCGQISDLIKQASKKAHIAMAISEDDALGQLLQSYSGTSALTSAEVQSATGAALWRRGLKAAVAVNKFNEMAHSHETHETEPSGIPIMQLQRWGYGCLDNTHRELVCATVEIFDDLHLLQVLGTSGATLQRYINALLSQYNDVPYHNKYHAFSVLQGCYWFIKICAGWEQLPKASQVWMLIAAIGHDCKHDGVNSVFHVTVESEIANLYNDRSPLENMHARATLQTMRQSGCDIFESLSPKQRAEARTSIVSMILATDMKFHDEKLKKLQRYSEIHQRLDLTDPKEAQMLLEFSLHAVDIGHPAYAWEEECRWARLVASEFQAQVDREKALGLPESGHMKCSGEQHLAKGQVGFFKFWVAPYFEELAEQVPELQTCVKQIADNAKNFAEVAEGSRSMIPAVGRDNEMMGWSVGVAKNALGDVHPALVAAKAVTVLMNREASNSNKASPESSQRKRAQTAPSTIVEAQTTVSRSTDTDTARP